MTHQALLLIQKARHAHVAFDSASDRERQGLGKAAAVYARVWARRLEGPWPAMAESKNSPVATT